MKTKLTVLFIFFLLQLSCDNSIDYIGDFSQQYSLNCVLRSDKNVQYATIKRSYPPESAAAQTDIQNAVVSLILPDTTFFFRDSILSGESSGNVGSFYYINNFSLTKNTELKIQAVLPDNTVLTAQVKSAGYTRVLLESEDLVLPGSEDESAFFMWRILGERDSIILLPSLYIRYVISGPDTAVKYKKINGTYIQNGDVFRVANSALSLGMGQISEGIADKSSITIIDGFFELKLCDFMMGMYASAAETFEDEFSVRISAPDFSNINGGLGIFGTYMSESFDILFLPEYVASFGYNLAPPSADK
jgi:hypothetical protein